MDIYLDASRPAAERALDLISRMKFEEKIAQMGSVWAMELLEDGKFSSPLARNLISHGLGQASRAGVGTGLEPARIAMFVNDLQRFLVKETRLGIPAIVHEECLTGFMAREATIFPQIIGMASTWDPDLMSRVTGVIRRQMLAVGVRQGLSPVLDVARDPRWGRIEETFGEDPYLIAKMGVAFIRGLQGDNIKQGVIATPKHFAGYGKSEAGLNHAPSDIPSRLLREVYLYPFEKAVREAGALSIMNAYQEIDGVPCAASRELLTNILRDEWGFDGIVVSDYFAVQMLNTHHRVAKNSLEAAFLAISAGIDLELPRGDCFTSDLKEKIDSGDLPMAVIDRAVFNVLKIKIMLGLFEKPYVSPPAVKKLFDTGADRKLALEAAHKSIVLLKNEGGLLPLAGDTGKIAVIGPVAHDARLQLGDYTYPAHIGLTAITAQSLNCRLPAEGIQPDMIPVHITTLLDGIKSAVGAKTEVIHVRGCQYDGHFDVEIDEAVKLAAMSDIVILALGGKSGLTTECTCGEMRDSASLRFPAVQETLARAVFDAGKPVVLVVMDGRPLELGWMAQKIPAIIWAWKPGEEGGNALADVLFGRYNPGGKLSITFPHNVGQVPLYYALKPNGGKSQFWGDYIDCQAGPLYEFGYGLSYTTFELSNLVISPSHIKPDGLITIKCNVKNKGSRPGDEVVQLYVNDVVASLTRPVLELKGFRRVSLQPGQSKEVVFELPVEEMAFYGRDMKPVLESGLFKVMVGTSSKNISLQGDFFVLQ
ncbi:MAG: glycoside hydrolase family 3 N-terminal domain-containing protein [Dehalococcoidia bacterium]